MHGFQAAGAAPIVRGAPVEKPETIATAIKIGNPATWQGAVAARDESRGSIDSVTDEEILEAYRSLAELEGAFCEPSSAAIRRGRGEGRRRRRDRRRRAGRGGPDRQRLQDPETAERAVAGRIIESEASEADVMRALGW